MRTLRELVEWVNNNKDVSDDSILDCELCYCIDDEGNRFKPVNFTPSKGNFHEEDGEFVGDDDPSFDPDLGIQVCIN